MGEEGSGCGQGGEAYTASSSPSICTIGYDIHD